MTSLGMGRDSVTMDRRAASAAAKRILRRDGVPTETELAVLPGCGAELAGRPLRLPAALERARPRPGRGVRARREPLVEPRSVAARAAALPPPVSPFHGEEGALLAAARLDRPRGRRLSRRPGQARPAGGRDRDRA